MTPVNIGMPSAQELMVYQTWAKNAEASQMYRNVGKEAGIMMIMLAAREYGIGPAQALNGGLHIIEGKVELSARIMSALIRRAKHTLEILESTDQKCVIKGTRSDTGESHTVTYTIDMAQRAGLIKDKGGWKRTPEDMLFARTISRLARQLFSDVIGVGYIEGEISDCRASNAEIRPLEEMPLHERYAKLFSELYSHFKGQEKDLTVFVKEFCKHYNLEEIQALEKLVENIDTTIANFNAWKNKRMKDEKLIEIPIVRDSN